MVPEAVPLHEALRSVNDQLTDALKNDPLLDVRRVLLNSARAKLNQLVKGEYANLKVKSFIGKIRSGIDTGSPLSFRLV